MNNPDPQTIRDTRLAAKHSLSKAARLVCVSRSAWCKWESGDRKMPPGLWLLYRFQTMYPIIFSNLMPFHENPQLDSQNGRPRNKP